MYTINQKKRSLASIDGFRSICEQIGYKFVIFDDPTDVAAPCFYCGDPCAHGDDIYCSEQCAINAETDR